MKNVAKFFKIFIFMIFSLIFFNGINISNAQIPTKRQRISCVSTSQPFIEQPIYPSFTEVRKVPQPQKTINQYMLEAEKGDADAQFSLGCIYQIGFDTFNFLIDTADVDEKCIVQNLQKKLSIDYYEAFYWFQQAAEQNHIPAKSHLAAFYLGLGNIVPTDTDKAISLLKEAADAKYIPAIHELGNIYYNGKHVPKNLVLAFEYYHYATKFNFAPAIFSLANMYECGEAPGNKNIILALNMYELAASLRSEHALYRLAQIYKNGEYGKPVDLAKAFRLFLQAAQLNNAPAIFEVAQMYYNGNEVISKNEKIALTLYQKAATLNHIPSMFILKNAYLTGEMGVKLNPILSKYYEKIISAALPEVKLELADLLVHKAIDMPNSVNIGMDLLKELISSKSHLIGMAAFFIGEVYECGCPEDQIKQDLPKAIHMYKIAATNNNVLAQYTLGRIYQYGYANAGILPNISLSISYYTDAAKNGFDFAQNVLGLIYWNGICCQEGMIKKQPNKAIKYLKLAADQDCAEAQCNLGYIYLTLYPKDYKYRETAVQLIKRATEQNCDLAWFNLGYMYEHGLGVTKNLVEAKKCYQIASMQNHSLAIEALRRIDDEITKMN